MARKNLALTLAVCFLLAWTAYATAIKIHENKNDAFGIFEVVDCATIGSQPKPLKSSEDSRPMFYCLAAKPIVDRTHLKSAESSMGDFGNALLLLSLTPEGGKIMEQASTRLLAEHGTKGDDARLAIVINGNLVAVPSLRNAVKDRIVVEGGLRNKDVNRIVESLNSKAGAPPPGKEKGRNPSQLSESLHNTSYRTLIIFPDLASNPALRFGRMFVASLACGS